MDLPEHIAALTSAQLGMVARWQLVGHLDPVTADHLLASSRFERVHRGVHRVVGGAEHRDQAAIAATLRAGPGATLSGSVGLRLREVEGCDIGDGFAVLVPPRRRLTCTDLPLVRDRAPHRPTWSRGDVRIADPIDALLEAAAYGSPQPRLVRLAHDRLRWSGALRPGRLRERAAALRLLNHPGVQELLGLDAEVATGDGERELGRLLARFDPPPEPQVWVTPHRCVDWFFRELSVGLEYQGRPDHATSSGRQADRVRDDELALAGIRLLYVTGEDLASPRTLLARIAGALTARADELALPSPRLLGAGPR